LRESGPVRGRPVYRPHDQPFAAAGPARAFSTPALDVGEMQFMRDFGEVVR
jgi:hypothetical protein